MSCLELYYEEAQKIITSGRPKFINLDPYFNIRLKFISSSLTNRNKQNAKKPESILLEIQEGINKLEKLEAIWSLTNDEEMTLRSLINKAKAITTHISIKWHTFKMQLD